MSDPTSDAPAVDHELLLAEIYEEVSRRRDAGEIPADLERELDQAFLEIAPPGAAGDDSALLVERVERAAFIDVQMPLDEVRPPVRQVKTGLRKLMAWYLHYVTQQVNAFASAAAGLGRSLDERVRALEEGTSTLPRSVRDELDRIGPRTYPQEALDAAAAALREVTDRVVVAHCGDATLVRRLRDADADAYGVEPRRALTTGALRTGIEVRATTALEHLRAVPAERLGGVVLLDVTDTSTPNVAVELAHNAARVLRPGGVVAVVATTPAAWHDEAMAPLSDLVPGRPLHAATWQHIFRGRGLDVDDTVVASTAYVVVARRPS